MNPWSGLLNRVNAADDGRTPEMRRLVMFNPRPKDTIRPGSATECVLTYLRETKISWANFAQIKRATGRTDKALDHALRYLRALGLVDTVDAADHRNQRYLRYCLKQGAPDAKVAQAPNPKARTRSLARDEVSLPEPDAQGFPALRGQVDHDLPGVVAELHELPGGPGSSAITNLLAGAAGRDQGVLSRELPLDDPRPADQAAHLHPDGDLQRAGIDAERAGPESGRGLCNAIQASVELPVQPDRGNHPKPAHSQKRADADPSRRHPAAGAVGIRYRHFTRPLVESAQAGLDN